MTVMEQLFNLYYELMNEGSPVGEESPTFYRLCAQIDTLKARLAAITQAEAAAA